MSIVEKAAEKLKALPLEPNAPVAAESMPLPTVPTVERLQERSQAVERPAGAEPSCHVDLAALKRVGVLPADVEAERRLADELRRVKRPLLNNAIGKGAETFVRGMRIAVTSAEAGE
ncbi:MAG: exopolysaccharide biosynthesis protein, partial [Rhodanobacter sp.]